MQRLRSWFAPRRRPWLAALAIPLIGLTAVAATMAWRSAHYRRQADHYRRLATAPISFTPNGLSPEEVARAYEQERAYTAQHDRMRKRYEWAAAHPWVSDPGKP